MLAPSPEVEILKCGPTGLGKSSCSDVDEVKLGDTFLLSGKKTDAERSQPSKNSASRLKELVGDYMLLEHIYGPLNGSGR